VTFGYKSYSRKKLNTSEVKCHQYVTKWKSTFKDELKSEGET